MSLLPLLALTALSAPAGQDAGWPQFLGPDRSGAVADTGWSADGAAAPLWARNVGRGYSCPSIVGRRLVTMGYDADAQLDQVLCLDAETGAELWRHAYAATDEPRYHGGGTLTTPAIADGVVYTVNRHGRAFALALETGAPLWERDYRAELELPRTFHGYCASPVVVGERIVHAFGGIAAVVERDGGALVWRTEDHGDGAYTNPTVFERDGRALVAVMLGQTLFVLDLEDGAVVHELAWPLTGNAVHVAQPLAIDDRLLVSTAYGKGAAMLRLGDALEPEVLWTSRRLRNKVTGVYRRGAHLYGFDESMLKCLDLEGNERWRVRGLGMGALSIAGDRLLVLSSAGELVVAEATPEEYRELSRKQVLEGGAYWTMPVLVGGRIYVRNSLGDLACLDHRGGADGGAAGAAVAGPAPDAAALFAAHSEAVGGAAIRAAAGLRLAGEWEIPGRGMSPTPASLLLAAPNRWRLALDSGQLVDTFDGELGWEQKNGAFRLFDAAEAGDAPRVLALGALFAPRCPERAAVEPAPVRFAGLPCWRVVSPMPGAGEEGDAARTVTHLFEAATGRLVAREGDELSTTVFHGARAVGEALLPERIVIFRTGSGQEESFTVTGGEWLDPGDHAVDDAFARPTGIARLLRTPEQRAADSAILRERYAAELGLYEAQEGPEREEDIRIAVDDGDLVLRVEQERIVLEPDPEDAGAFAMTGTGATLRFERGADGAVTGARILAGPDTIVFTKAE